MPIYLQCPAALISTTGIVWLWRIT